MKALLIAAMIILVGAGTAAADARAEAILLFDQGLKEMKAGNYEKACKFFEDSNARYSDSGTKGSLAKCYEKLGKLASSWLLWRELADTAPTSELRKDATTQAAKIDARVPKYVVKLIAPTPGLVLSINGKSAGTSGMPVPIDPGNVAVVASAPDHEDWKTDVVAAEGKTVTIEVPALVAAPKTIDPVKQPPPPPITDGSKRRNRRIIAASFVVAGAAAAAVGGVFGLSASGKFDDAKETCGGSVDNCLTDRVAEAQAQVDDARSAATMSSVLFAAGGALVVTGAVLWFTAPAVEKRVAIAPLAQPNAAGLALSGRF